MERYRLIDDDQPNGTARSQERRGDAGDRVVEFEAEIGQPRPSLSLAGRVELGSDLSWRRLVLDAGGRLLDLDLGQGAELEIDGVPALYGVTTRRLCGDALRPSQVREVDVLRIGADLRSQRAVARYTWLGGQSWSYTSGRDTFWLRVRPDGIVRSVEATAELEEG